MTIDLSPDNPFAVDVALADWQVAACDSWVAGDQGGAYRGTLEVFTGGGKSLIAIECMRRATDVAPGLRVAVVVPTLALARQWRRVLTTRTALTDDDIGELHGMRKDDLSTSRVLITVLNSAATVLPEMARNLNSPLMLVVDESHRAGAAQFSNVLTARSQFRLGLSATAERDDVDEDGVPIEYDEHILGQLLGGIVYTFDLRKARAVGWLPEFTVLHHAVHLLDDERRRYDEISRKIDDLADRLKDIGIDASAARQSVSRDGEAGQLARSYVGSVSLRKDLLYRAAERTRVTEQIVLERSSRPGSPPHILLFHERIEQATALFLQLESHRLAGGVVLEHSRLPESQRQSAMAAFADGSALVLVSVKSLVEGIDVPDADIGVSVASSSSVRQRVQALGRVLRRRFDGSTKVAEMHLLYVADSVDELIYEKEDWSDLTGEAANFYFDWGIGVDAPAHLEGPPRTPRPTEDQFWESIKTHMESLPVEWPCEWPRSEWRLDGRGNVTDLDGRLVANPQGAVEAVRLLKPDGGRFRISNLHQLIVVPDMGSGEMRAWLVGALDERFRLLANDSPPTGRELEGGRPADDGAFVGPLDKKGGSYQIRQKGGGLIERRAGGVREFAAADGPADDDPRKRNAHNVLEAWRATGESGMKFCINSVGDAYYLAGGQPRLLAHVPEGFAWPEGELT